MKIFCVLVVVVFITFFATSQEMIETEVFLSSSSEFQGKPNFDSERFIRLKGFNKKFVKSLDFTFQIDEALNNVTSFGGKKSFWAQWSLESLPLVDLTDDHINKYFIGFENYYNSLSTNVQYIFTLSEIWYIYMYQEENYNELKKL